VKRYLSGKVLGLAIPAAAGVLFLAPVASASASTTPAVHAQTASHTRPSPPLACQASVSNSNPRDYSFVFVNVTTGRGALVTAVAHFRTGDQVRTVRADGRGNAQIGYAVGNARPGYPVYVSVTVKSGRSHASCFTSFTPRR
jgi:hypothetical protein